MRIRSLFFALFLIAACGPSVQQTCNDYAVAWCNVHYTCDTGATLDALKATYGSTPQACAVAKANAFNLNCLGAQSVCPPGTSYDTGAVETCIADTNRQSCADVAAQQDPGSCNQTKTCH